MQYDKSKRGCEFVTGTGGNGHAGDYYRENKYPLVVKMGTISPDGADVYSYPEDDMVLVCMVRSVCRIMIRHSVGFVNLCDI